MALSVSKEYWKIADVFNDSVQMSLRAGSGDTTQDVTSRRPPNADESGYGANDGQSEMNPCSPVDDRSMVIGTFCGRARIRAASCNVPG